MEANKEGLNDPDNHYGVVSHLELNILGCEVKRALRSIILNKVSGDDRITDELFKILKYDVTKVLDSICQQIWKTQQWSQDWKMLILIPISKKGNVTDCSN